MRRTTLIRPSKRRVEPVRRHSNTAAVVVGRSGLLWTTAICAAISQTAPSHRVADSYRRDRPSGIGAGENLLRLPGDQIQRAFGRRLWDDRVVFVGTCSETTWFHVVRTPKEQPHIVSRLPSCLKERRHSPHIISSHLISSELNGSECAEQL